eukprot:Tbor_TRINITY_DN2001_c0_g1::TRINITY_DN2001_c0_g1_i1::g.12124::m.12124/K07200/PRKAG; 5'-AMP-activated protein kinase, regulatory gamma subunit
MQSVIQAELNRAKREHHGHYAHPKRSTNVTDAVAHCDSLPEVSIEQVHRLCAPIASILEEITCYEVIGNSTQVVVVEENCLLNIPFIAAQESQVTTCIIWSSEAMKFTGLLSVTEYLKVLLYCEENPKEVDRIAELSVKEWQKMRAANKGKERNEAQILLSGDTGCVGSVRLIGNDQLISVTPRDSLAACIGKMMEYDVRRLAVVADDVRSTNMIGNENIIAVITSQTLMQHMTTKFFSVDVNGIRPSVSKLPDDDTVQSAGVDMVDNRIEAVLRADIDGAYPSIFDVPFVKLNKLGRLNLHRHTTGVFPPLIYVTKDTHLCDVIRLLLNNQVHAVPIVADTASMVIEDVITRSDVLRMETGGVFNLQITVREATAYRGEILSDTGRSNSVAVFYETDCIRDIIIHFASMNVKVLFLVDHKTGAVLGQLALTEVLCFLFDCSCPK